MIRTRRAAYLRIGLSGISIRKQPRLLRAALRKACRAKTILVSRVTADRVRLQECIAITSRSSRLILTWIWRLARSGFSSTRRCVVTSLRKERWWAIIRAVTKTRSVSNKFVDLIVSSLMDERTWKIAGRVVDLSRRGMIMGVLNVTPDSFSDGGEFFSTEKAVEHGLQMAADGAQIIDVGGESTRPGAEPTSVDEELRRVIPVIENLRRKIDIFILIDHSKAEVASAALDAGASITRLVISFTGFGSSVRFCRSSKLSNGLCSRWL